MKTKNKTLSCIACPKGSDVEVLHPKLQIPICGACDAALKDADQVIINGNMVSCIWCGLGDGCELFMCDTCTYAFCTDCVSRNFGNKEAETVRQAKYWRCYSCVPTAKFKSLQVSEVVQFFNIDKAYAAVRPPQGQDFEGINLSLVNELTSNEKQFASLFCHGVISSSIQDLNIVADYLKAGDVLSTMYRVSKNLRAFFKSKVFLIPGLFRTEYGQEHCCKLHYHQLVGLNYMNMIENRTSEFGAMRGGIFGDEPGLGKTVTCLALIASSAGTNPTLPPIERDEQAIAAQWAAMRGQHKDLLLPVVNSMRRSYAINRVEAAKFDQLARELERHCESQCETLEMFQNKVKSVIRDVAGSRLEIKDKLLDTLRAGMDSVLDGLDSKKRKDSHSLQTQRIRYERSLRPSAGTLIIVPQALLEHWYEQIRRHLNLAYFARNEGQSASSSSSSSPSSTKEPAASATANDAEPALESGLDESCRGIVYMYGLGDIVDIVPPIVKLSQSKIGENFDNRLAQTLSHYLIVVTTFERCAAEFKLNETDKYNNKGVPLHQIRWLRLVVDEGHEIGQPVVKKKASAAAPVAQALFPVPPVAPGAAAVPVALPVPAGAAANAVPGGGGNDGGGAAVAVPIPAVPAPAPVSVPPKTTPKKDKLDTSVPSYNAAVSNVSFFISQIAAERRWIMSGTPTTGTNSETGLTQLYRLLCFLRHPLIIQHDSVQTGSRSAPDTPGSAKKARMSKTTRVMSSPAPLSPQPTSSATMSSTGYTGQLSANYFNSTEEDDTWSVGKSEFGGTYSTASARASGGGGYTSNSAPASASNRPLSLATPSAVRYKNSADYWMRAVVAPCLQQKEEAWDALTDLLRSIMVRHTKADLCLYKPIHSTHNLDAINCAGDGEDERHVLGGDRAKAAHISNTMLRAQKEWLQYMRGNNTRQSLGSSLLMQSPAAKANTAKQLNSSATTDDFQDTTRGPQQFSTEEVAQFKRRRPKAIVFSQHETDLQGVGHFLYTNLGDSYLCEHFGAYQSSELSRFRHSKRQFRACPLCGFSNSVACGSACANTLLMVEYCDVPLPVVVPPPTAAAATAAAGGDGGAEDQMVVTAGAPQPTVPVFPPSISGHSADGPGGHYTGLCLCSPQGCAAQKNNRRKSACSGYPNPFNNGALEIRNPNCALIGPQHIHGWQLGMMNFTAGQYVYVNHVPASTAGAADSSESTEAGGEQPLLWRAGILGGRAIIRMWRKCGGKEDHCWFNSRILATVPWKVEEETAFILLLKEDGSTGLDLSFCTHIFLLERIKDPALRNQIVSRAHRMGATGPVEVHLIQVKAATDEAP